MAHHTNHRRNLAAALDPKPSMDPTHKKHPISTSSSSTTKPHHLTHPDPTIPPSTIQNISNNFSKLYTNHKILTSTRGSTDHSHPSVDTHLQAKAMTVSSNLNNSCTTLTKSKSQHGSTRTMIKEVVKVKVPFEVHDIDKAFVKQKAYEIKKPSSMKESKSKEFYYEEEQDLKKKASSALMMSRSYEGGDEMKRFQEGCEMKRPSFSLAVNGGGRRRSFCSSQTELADFFSCNGVKVVSVDMPPFMQIHVVDCARKAYDSLEKFTARTLACTLKKEFDGVYGPAWHCIVGTSFGSFVTHSVGGFMYFSMDHKLYVLLFKTTVQKAE